MILYNRDARGNKNQIYFAAHHDDLGEYMDDFCEKALKVVSCSVYYDNPDSVPDMDESRKAELSAIKYFVIAVTEKLLNDSSSPARAIIEFAFKNNIPVLPVTKNRERFKKKFNRAFEQIFGACQYLVTDDEEGEKNFCDKLRRFFERVFINDELVREVKQVFTSSIFLSYRRQNKPEAKELMHLLLKNDVCIDTALWYDDFLVPGELYDNSIDNSIVKCDLFVLAVTPDLLKPNAQNKDNYVKAQEYPRACELKKPVLPVEMIPTDRDGLEKSFRDIPDCVKKNDSEKLIEQLGKYIHPKETDKIEPARKKLLKGIAYLNGIDTVVDRELGFSFIKEAAHCGEDTSEETAKAVKEQLEALFLTGNGVEASINDALDIGRELCSASWAKFNETESEEDGKAAYSEYHKQYTIFSDYGINVEEFRNMLLTCADKLFKLYDTEENAYLVCDAMEIKGNYWLRTGSYEDADELFDNEHTFLLSVQYRYGHTDKNRLYIYRCVLNRGSVYMKKGHYSDAENYIDTALKKSERLLDKLLDDPEADREMLTEAWDLLIKAGYSSAMHFFSVYNIFDVAAFRFEVSFNECTKLEDFIGETPLKYEVFRAKALFYEGQSYRQLKLWDKAEKAYRKALYILEKCPAEHIDIRSALAINKFGIAELYIKFNNIPYSIEQLEEACDIWDGLYTDCSELGLPVDPESIRINLAAVRLLAECYEKVYDMKSAAECIVRSLPTADMLMEKTDVFEAHMAKYDQYRIAAMITGKSEYYITAYKIIHNLVRCNETNKRMKLELADLHIHFSLNARDIGGIKPDPEEYKTLLNEGIIIYEKCKDSIDEHMREYFESNIREAASILQSYGDIRYTFTPAELGKILEKNGYYRNAEIFYLLAADEGDTDALYSLGTIMLNHDSEHRTDGLNYCFTAARSGHKEAQKIISSLSPADSLLLENDFKKRADKGDPDAFFSLALLLRNDPARRIDAANYCLDAARMGHEEAAETIGSILFPSLAKTDESENIPNEREDTGYTEDGNDFSLYDYKPTEEETGDDFDITPSDEILGTSDDEMPFPDDFWEDIFGDDDNI